MHKKGVNMKNFANKYIKKCIPVLFGLVVFQHINCSEETRESRFKQLKEPFLTASHRAAAQPIRSVPDSQETMHADSKDHITDTSIASDDAERQKKQKRNCRLRYAGYAGIIIAVILIVNYVHPNSNLDPLIRPWGDCLNAQETTEMPNSAWTVKTLNCSLCTDGQWRDPGVGLCQIPPTNLESFEKIIRDTLDPICGNQTSYCIVTNGDTCPDDENLPDLSQDLTLLKQFLIQSCPTPIPQNCTNITDFETVKSRYLKAHHSQPKNSKTPDIRKQLAQKKAPKIATMLKKFESKRNPQSQKPYKPRIQKRMK